MRCCSQVDSVKAFNLLTGMIGIYILYTLSGLIHERLMKSPYLNRMTKKEQIFQNSLGLVFIPFFVSWLMAQIYIRAFVGHRVKIPTKNSLITAIVLVGGSLFSILAIQRTSFPVVIMFESSTVVPVVLVGVFCSRVRDSNLKLGPKKIIVALVIALGILIFQFSDPQTRQRSTKAEVLGLLFILLHFFFEGFLPDLQAEIKVEYKPSPIEMMCEINKWATIIVFIALACSMTLLSFIQFLWEHPMFTLQLFLMSILSGFGQFFIYRMIKQFKQHFVPFTVSSRKILTVSLSIIFNHHKTNIFQILGIIIVLSAIFMDFFTEISKEEPREEDFNEQCAENKNNQIEKPSPDIAEHPYEINQ